MAERERSRDRPGHSSSPSASGTGPFASILNLISSTRGGKGKPSVFSVVPTTSASASLEELVLPPHGIHSIPFDLDTAIRSMESSETSKAELCEVVKATTIYIARREDVFAPQMKPQVPAAEVRTLYIRASALVKVDSDKALRDAAMGLLTALTVVFPPSASAGVDDELISIRSLYSLIISSTASSISADSIVSQVTALKGLTKDGTEVTGMDGIVGWLIRSLSGMSEQWTAWCGLRGGAAELRGSVSHTVAIMKSLISSRLTPCPQLIRRSPSSISLSRSSLIITLCSPLPTSRASWCPFLNTSGRASPLLPLRPTSSHLLFPPRLVVALPSQARVPLFADPSCPADLAKTPLLILALLPHKAASHRPHPLCRPSAVHFCQKRSRF